MSASKVLQAQLEQTRNTEGNIVFKCTGSWSVTTLQAVTEALKHITPDDQTTAFIWNLTAIDHIDSAGMMLILHHYDSLKSKGNSVEITGMDPGQEHLYQLIRSHINRKNKPEAFSASHLSNPLYLIGKSIYTSLNRLNNILAFIGENFITLLYSLRHPASIRYSAIIENIYDTGVRALPIIAVTSFLIGVVIAYQGAVQLEKFGANIFIVDMIGLSISRELAPLITAIVIAGRTGSSYTAQLGAMKITEEMDAMRTMGFDPQRFLILPRILALMITLPLLIFFADIIGILGGMFIAHTHMHLSYGEFLNRLQSVLQVKHVWIGIAKGPFFAWLIAITGCYYGFQVSNNTESIGRYTTISVVNAIFLVIACDALFSVIFTALGI